MQISDDDGTYVVDVKSGKAIGPKAFPHGTPVIFLGWHEDIQERRHGNIKNKAQILIEGRVGWVYEDDLETFNETR